MARDAAALEQPRPVVVDLGLVAAADLEGDGFGEGEGRGPAVQRDEGLARQAEFHGEHFAWGLLVCFLAGLEVLAHVSRGFESLWF